MNPTDEITRINQADQDRIANLRASTRPTHTPGPWAIHESAFSSSLVKELHIGTPTRTAACVYDDCAAGILVRSEIEANARLIASAPELIEALEAVLPDLEHYVATHGPGPDKRLAIARAAIAKARG